MRCWRCGRAEHADWCSMPGGCDHCGWSPHRWWCLGEEYVATGYRQSSGAWDRGGGMVLRLREPAR